MKLVRHAFAVLAFLIAWLGIAVVVGLALKLVLGPESDGGFGWRAAPGGILGFWAGACLFRVITKPQPKQTIKSVG